MPIMAERMTLTKPTMSDTCDPYRIAERTSRPWLSVPRTNLGSPPEAQIGGSSLSSRLKVLTSNGLCGAIHGANTADSIMSAVTAAARTVTLERRKL